MGKIGCGKTKLLNKLWGTNYPCAEGVETLAKTII